MFNVKALFAQIGLPASPCPYEGNNLIQIQRNGYGPGAELRKGFMLKVLYEGFYDFFLFHKETIC